MQAACGRSDAETQEAAVPVSDIDQHDIGNQLAVVDSLRTSTPSTTKLRSVHESFHHVGNWVAGYLLKAELCYLVCSKVLHVMSRVKAVCQQITLIGRQRSKRKCGPFLLTGSLRYGFLLLFCVVFSVKAEKP